MVVLAVVPALLSAPATPASAPSGVSAARSEASGPEDSGVLGPRLSDVQSRALLGFVPREPAPEPEPEPDGGIAAAAVQAATMAAETVRGLDLRIAVLDRELGELVSAGAAAEPTYTASLSKLVVAVDVVDRRRVEGLVVTERDLDLFRRALGPSDDSAMNALWSRFGGSTAAARVAARLGLAETLNPRDPSQWGEMLVSADDQARIYEHVLAMPAEDRDLILGALSAAPPVARDGFDQDFGLLAPEIAALAGPVATKQAWMCCFSQRYYLHSAGVIGEDARFVVSLLSIQPRSGGWAAARGGLTT
ncbi:serine hydrolase, partial [Pseudonocardia pini]|uniref:serine hydrolase n=1 Tax=Pseudonocardia pini TaxID=2758030 RepID=UPI0015F09645